jgi:hypothetical protein
LGPGNGNARGRVPWPASQARAVLSPDLGPPTVAARLTWSISPPRRTQQFLPTSWVNPYRGREWMSDPFTEFLGAIAAGEDTRTDQAALALARRGDAALPSLHELLRDADPERRWWAARAMAAVGTESARTLLIVALGDPDAYVRACAAHGLGEPGGGLEKAVPPLVRSLADVSPLVSRVAADSLARIGSPAVPALIAALEAEGPCLVYHPAGGGSPCFVRCPGRPQCCRHLLCRGSVGAPGRRVSALPALNGAKMYQPRDT